MWQELWQVGDYVQVNEPAYPEGFGGLAALPDLGSMTDAELSDLLRDALAKAELSPNDRLLQGRVDILRAEVVARGGDPLAPPS